MHWVICIGRRGTAYISIIFFAVSFLLTGCSVSTSADGSDAVEEIEAEQSVAPQVDTDSVIETYDSSNTLLSIEDVLNKRSGFFIGDDESGYIELQNGYDVVDLTGGLLPRKYIPVNPNQGEVPTFDKSSSSQLISRHDIDLDYGACAAAVRITNEGYYSDYSFGILDPSDEVEEVAVGEARSSEDRNLRVLDILHQAGLNVDYDGDYQWVSDSPIDIHVGRWDGPDLTEYTVSIDSPYIQCEQDGNSPCGDNFMPLPTERTRNGYYTIDISSLEPGEYLIGIAAKGQAIHTDRYEWTSYFQSGEAFRLSIK